MNNNVIRPPRSARGEILFASYLLRRRHRHSRHPTLTLSFSLQGQQGAAGCGGVCLYELQQHLRGTRSSAGQVRHEEVPRRQDRIAAGPVASKVTRKRKKGGEKVACTPVDVETHSRVCARKNFRQRRKIIYARLHNARSLLFLNSCLNRCVSDLVLAVYFNGSLSTTSD